MTQQTVAPLRRTAKIRLDPELLNRMLRLPAGMRVVHVDATNDPIGVYALVEGTDLPEVPHECISPYAQIEWEVLADDTGREVVAVKEIHWPEEIR